MRILSASASAAACRVQGLKPGFFYALFGTTEVVP
jgi:hypothetical protein